MDEKKVLLVSHVSGFVPQFEMNNVRILQDMGYEVHYASNFNTPAYGMDNERLKGTGIVQHQVDFVRSPWNVTANLKAYLQLKHLMEEQSFSLVHCHNPMSAALTRIAAKASGTRPVLYTAHGFHFYQGAPFHMWVIYGSMEWLLSFLTDQQICINKEDYLFAKHFFHAGRINYIPGVGINTGKIHEVSADREKKRTELGIPEDAIVLVSAGEMIPRKNQETILKALAVLNRGKGQIDADRPEYFCVICGHGELQEKLLTLAKELKVEQQVIFPGYRKDLWEIYKVSDIFVFPSLQEGLPAALLEAMAAGLPVVCSDIRGNNELIRNSFGGYRVAPGAVSAYVRRIRELSSDPEKMEKMGNSNRMKAEDYREENTRRVMKGIYQYWLNRKG